MKTDAGQCFFASDLHGDTARYQKLIALILEERPRGVFLGGDLLPMFYMNNSDRGEDWRDFVNDYLVPRFRDLQCRLGPDYPEIYVILGNDDLRVEEEGFVEAEKEGLWKYAHDRRLDFADLTVYGYSFVPPTPFMLKDWERYDVSRYVDPGCLSPEEGRRSVPESPAAVRYSSIQKDLLKLTGEDDLSRAIFLFHSPPYNTLLDRAALDGKMVDHVPMDLHVGSIAIQRFIESRQPLLTLHGHVHESTRITGSWRDLIGRTHAFQAAHEGPELSLIRFDPGRLRQASHALI